VGTGCASLG